MLKKEHEKSQEVSIGFVLQIHCESGQNQDFYVLLL